MNPPFRFRPYPSAALLAVLLTGCVTHTPMSEMVMFHSPATHPAYENRRGYGVGLTASPPSPVPQSLARLHYPTANRVGVFNPRQFSLGWHTTGFDRKGRLAISLTVGAPVMGADATVQLWHRNYLTAGASVPGQLQAFLQHRSFNSSRLAAAVGLGVRRDAYVLTPPSEAMFYSEIEYLTSVGMRSFLIYRANDSETGGVRIGVYAGYAPAIHQPMLSLSMNFGRF